MAWAKLDQSLIRSTRRPAVRKGGFFDPLGMVEVDVGDDGFDHWCPVCEADPGDLCAEGSEQIHRAREQIGMALCEPQDPKHTPMQFKHARAEQYACPYCLMPVGRSCSDGAFSGDGVHLARIALSEIAAANVQGALLCCYNVGGGGVCGETGRPCGMGLAFCEKHWVQGRAQSADAGGLLCEADGCSNVATTNAGKRASSDGAGNVISPAVSMFWCDSHIPGDSRFQTRRLQHATSTRTRP